MLHSTATVRLIALSTLALLLSLAAPRQDPKGGPAAARPPGLPHGPRAWHVQLELGPKFDTKVAMTSQAGFEEHATRVHGMADDGTLLLGGPILESAESEKITGAVLILHAKDEKEIREKLGSDPFLAGGVMKIASVRPMMVGLGAWMPKEKPADGGK